MGWGMSIEVVWCGVEWVPERVADGGGGAIDLLIGVQSSDVQTDRRLRRFALHITRAHDCDAVRSQLHATPTSQHTTPHHTAPHITQISTSEERDEGGGEEGGTEWVAYGLRHGIEKASVEHTSGVERSGEAQVNDR
jgi:hypothetical protein